MAISRNVLVRVGSDINPLTRGMQQAQTVVRGFATSSQSSLARMAATFSVVNIAMNAMANVASQAFRAMTTDAIKNYNDMTSANIGLKSILDAQGKSYQEATGFIKSYVSDGLIPLTDATTAFKTLSAAGYNVEQTEQVMLRLKDASAFGRQASLTMGEAVKSAAEGIKNENSILVDNSGITKNLSLMWADYARSIGVGVDSLNRQQKIQAVVNGIMTESRFQLGDAAKYAGTLGGQMSTLSAGVTRLSAAFGASLAPILQALMPYLTSFIDVMTNAINRVSMFMSVLFGTNTKQIQTSQTAKKAADAQTSLGDATKKAADKVKSSTRSFDELNTLQKNISDNANDAANAISSTTTTPTVATTDTASVGNIIPQGVIDAVNTLKEKLDPIWTLIKEIGVEIRDIFNPAWQKYKDMGLDLYTGIFETALKLLKGTLEIVSGILSGDTSKVWQGFKDIVDGCSTAINTLYTWVKHLGDIAVSVFKGFIQHNKFLQEHKEAIKLVTGVLTLLFIPAIIELGIKASIAAIRSIAPLVGEIVLMGIMSAMTSVILVGDLIWSVIMFTYNAWKSVVAIAAQTAAWVWNKVVMIATTVATWAMQAATWALNAAMLASPTTWVIIGFAALAAILIYVWQTNEGFRKAVHTAWTYIRLAADWLAAAIVYSFKVIAWWFGEQLPLSAEKMKVGLILAFAGMGSKVAGIWESVKDVVANGIDWIIDKINSFIAMVNKMKINIPGVGEVGVNIKSIEKINTNKTNAGGGYFDNLAKEYTSIASSFAGRQNAIDGIKAGFLTPSQNVAMQAEKYAQESEYKPIDFNGIYSQLKQAIGVVPEQPKLSQPTSTVRTDSQSYNQSPTDTMAQFSSAIGKAVSDAMGLSKQNEIKLEMDGNTLARALLPKLQSEQQRIGTPAITLA